MNMLKPKNEKKLSYVFTSVSITIYLILTVNNRVVDR
jgi:hypothetical protein